MSAFEDWVKEYMCKPEVEHCRVSVKAGWRNAFEAGAKSMESANKRLKIELVELQSEKKRLRTALRAVMLQEQAGQPDGEYVSVSYDIAKEALK